MERRTLLAIFLSMAVIFLWSYLFKSSFTRPVSGPPLPREEPERIASKAELVVTQEVKDEKPILFQTPKYTVHFREKDASIAQIELKKYADLRSQGPTNLITEPSLNPGLLYTAGLAESEEIGFSKISQTEKSITFSSQLDDLQIVKRYVFPEDKYCIQLHLELRNLSPNVKTKSYNILAGSNIDNDPSVDGRFMEAFGSKQGKVFRESLRRISSKGEIFHPGNVSYVGIKNKYFSVIMKSFNPTDSSFIKSWSKDNLLAGINMREFDLPPNSSVSHQFILYAGPNSIQEMTKLNIGIENSISFGIFGGVSQFLLDILRFFHSFTHNWGLAIIFLTFLVSIVLFPLTYKSIKSMKEIQVLHPKIEKLRSQFKDNPQKFNKEVMQLYRKHKINPFGGCLPLILQMPIFISLYQALVRSVELRGADFLWIKDLSSPDQARLPLSLPILGNHINILPLLMVLAMVLQQKISTPSATPTGGSQQKTMGMVMILMFGIIFYNLPSGLVLYWLTNTLLSLVYNWRLQKSLVVSLED